ncbi:MAG: hypothetical protein ACRCTA_06080, partial [Bacilli bacterium]
MIIYNTYIKLLRKHWVLIAQNLLITIAITFLISSVGDTEKNQVDQLNAVKVSIINKENQDIDELVAYLDKEVTLVDIDFKDDKDIMNKLSYNVIVKYVLVVNKDGMESYYKPSDPVGAILDNKISMFNNLKKLYDINHVESNTLEDNLKATAETKYVVKNIVESKKLESVFNLFIYGLIGSLISATGVVAMRF